MKKLLSDGVKDLFESNKYIQGIGLLSEDYINRINSIPHVNIKIKILERLMRNEISNEISKYSKVNKIQAKSFTDKLK